MEKITTWFKRVGGSLDTVFERVTTALYTEYYINGNKVTRMEYAKRYNWFISNKDYEPHIYKEKR